MLKRKISRRIKSTSTSDSLENDDVCAEWPTSIIGTCGASWGRRITGLEPQSFVPIGVKSR